MGEFKIVKIASTSIKHLAWALLSIFIIRAAPLQSLPEPSGSYGIARVSYELIDPTRPEPLSSAPDGVRRMMVHVWYPCDRQSAKRAPSAPYLPGFRDVQAKLSKGDIADLFRPASYTGPDSLPTTAVVENAKIARGRQKFPLLLFAHGWGNPTFLYTAELQDIVSHGYVIAAVDHPYDTAYTQFPDGSVTFFAQERFDREVAKQPHGLSDYGKDRGEIMAQDNVYALSQILKYAATKTSGAPFYGRVDADKVGAFGHSIGGLTAARTCQLDRRVKACMDQDSTDYRGSPFIASGLEQTESQPFFLFVVSSADVWSSRALNPSDADLTQQKLSRAEFNAIMKEQQENQTNQMAAITGGSYRLMLFDVPGFTHRSFTDQTLLAQDLDHYQIVRNFKTIQTYTLAFFDKYLKGDNKTILEMGESVEVRAKLQKFAPH